MTLRLQMKLLLVVRLEKQKVVQRDNEISEGLAMMKVDILPDPNHL